MELEIAIAGLGALAHETRLKAFRLLVKAGPDGLPAGEIAAALGVPAATASFHLKELSNAGLVASRRESRSVIYRVAMEGMRDLLDFLTQDCCQGRPDLCGLTVPVREEEGG